MDNEILFVVEYKVEGELFSKKYVYDSKCLDAIDGLLYINTLSGSELTISRNYLEYRLERPLRLDEGIE